jgi:hypothetical protein
MGLKVISLPVLYGLVVVSGKFGWGMVTVLGACLTVGALLLWAHA